MSFCLLLDRESKANYTYTERSYKYNFTNLSSLEANIHPFLNDRASTHVGPFGETDAHIAYNLTADEVKP